MHQHLTHLPSILKTEYWTAHRWRPSKIATDVKSSNLSSWTSNAEVKQRTSRSMKQLCDDCFYRSRRNSINAGECRIYIEAHAVTCCSGERLHLRSLWVERGGKCGSVHITVSCPHVWPEHSDSEGTTHQGAAKEGRSWLRGIPCSHGGVLWPR